MRYQLAKQLRRTGMAEHIRLTCLLPQRYHTAQSRVGRQSDPVRQFIPQHIKGWCIFRHMAGQQNRPAGAQRTIHRIGGRPCLSHRVKCQQRTARQRLIFPPILCIMQQLFQPSGHAVPQGTRCCNLLSQCSTHIRMNSKINRHQRHQFQ